MFREVTFLNQGCLSMCGRRKIKLLKKRNGSNDDIKKGLLLLQIIIPLVRLAANCEHLALSDLLLSECNNAVLKIYIVTFLLRT